MKLESLRSPALFTMLTTSSHNPGPIILLYRIYMSLQNTLDPWLCENTEFVTDVRYTNQKKTNGDTIKAITEVPMVSQVMMPFVLFVGLRMMLPLVLDSP